MHGGRAVLLSKQTVSWVVGRLKDVKLLTEGYLEISHQVPFLSIRETIMKASLAQRVFKKPWPSLTLLSWIASCHGSILFPDRLTWTGSVEKYPKHPYVTGEFWSTTSSQIGSVLVVGGAAPIRSTANLHFFIVIYLNVVSIYSTSFFIMFPLFWSYFIEVPLRFSFTCISKCHSPFYPSSLGIPKLSHCISFHRNLVFAYKVLLSSQFHLLAS